MKSKLILLSAMALAVGFSAWLGYVKFQWPDEVKELDIPVGRVMTIPGTNHKGVCVQGDPNGFSAWHRVTPPTSNELDMQRAMFQAMQNIKWEK